MFLTLATTWLLTVACGTGAQTQTLMDGESTLRTGAVPIVHVAVTPTTAEKPEGWWDPIGEPQLATIEVAMLGIELWSNCVQFFDEPSDEREAQVRANIDAMVASETARDLGLIEGADLVAVCDDATRTSDLPLEITDGVRAAIFTDTLVDLVGSCLDFYDEPETWLEYRISTLFLETFFLLETDGPRWPRRNPWGVREWCDNIVDDILAG